MLTPPMVNVLSYFYPLGNTPAVCLTQDLPFDEPADILLLGCGDVRNILFTTYADTGPSPRPLDITCCDVEKAVLARNILLFTALIDDVNGKNHSSIWQSGISQTWYESKYGKILRFYDQETLNTVRLVWKSYIKPTVAQAATRAQLFKATIQKAQEIRSPCAGSRPVSVMTGFRSAAPVSLQALEDLPDFFEHWWKNGTTGKKSAGVKYPNPMFSSIKSDIFTLHYGTDPLHGFLLATAYVPLTKDSPLQSDQKSDVHKVVEAARTHFEAWSKSFRNHAPHLILRFFVGDALASCHTLQGVRTSGNDSSNWYRAHYSLKPLVLSENKLGSEHTAPLSFDVIDTSNLVDHLGCLNVLIAASPLLKSNMSASLL